MASREALLISPACDRSHTESHKVRAVHPPLHPLPADGMYFLALWRAIQRVCEEMSPSSSNSVAIGEQDKNEAPPPAVSTRIHDRIQLLGQPARLQVQISPVQSTQRSYGQDQVSVPSSLHHLTDPSRAHGSGALPVQLANVCLLFRDQTSRPRKHGAY